MSQAKKARNSCSREIMKQKELLVILRRIWVMTDSTEEDMTMFRWRSTLFQWDIIPETEEENQGNRRKLDETGQGDAQIGYLLIKFFRKWAGSF